MYSRLWLMSSTVQGPLMRQDLSGKIAHMMFVCVSIGPGFRSDLSDRAPKYRLFCMYSRLWLMSRTAQGPLGLGVYVSGGPCVFVCGSLLPIFCYRRGSAGHRKPFVAHGVAGLPDVWISSLMRQDLSAADSAHDVCVCFRWSGSRAGPSGVWCGFFCYFFAMGLACGMHVIQSYACRVRGRLRK